MAPTVMDGQTNSPRPAEEAQPAVNEDALRLDATENRRDEIELTVLHHGTPHAFTFSSSSTLQDLSDLVAAEFSIPESNQKFLVAPKVGLLKPPFSSSNAQLSSLTDKKITLMGSTTAEINTIQSNIAASTSSAARRGGRLGPIKPAAPARTRDWKRAKEDAEYTFHTLRPLPYLPKPERSLRFLEILRDDPGIRAAMRAHQFSVPLLTEMDPAQHTTHESRTLGLNRNRGEVIELRLRTDAYDGYRDYKTIRKTLCHELAHNVWGEHDRNFWELTKQIEKEVERGDWTRGGHRLSSEEFYNPNDGGYEEGAADHGGWTGGEFVLGGGNAGSGAAESSSAASGTTSLSRREILARAAEERMKKTKDVSKAAEQHPEDGNSHDND